MTEYGEQLKADWHSVARYEVYVTKYVYGRGKSESVRETGLTYTEAREAQSRHTEAIKADPSYRPCTMGNPVCCIRLEQPDATFAAYKAVREQRTDVAQASAVLHEEEEGCALA